MTTGLADFFRQHLWANLQLLETCAKLSDEQLDATMQGTFGCVRETLTHLFAAEERYIYRFTNQRPEPELSEHNPFVGFDELRRRARGSGEALLAIVEQGGEKRVLSVMYEGKQHELPATIVLIQAINHGTDHRSQISTLLSQQGITPPELDGWSYYEAMSQGQ